MNLIATFNMAHDWWQLVLFGGVIIVAIIAASGKGR